MHRLALASRAELEVVFRQGGTGKVDLDDAAYPDGCEPARGPVRFEAPARGGMIVRVTPGALETGDFRLGVLFERGCCIFGNADDFHAFCTGPLARALGLEPEEPPPPTEDQLPLADVLVAEARAVGTGRRLTAERLADRLARVIHGQDAALERVAAVVSAQLAKRRPSRPGSVLLLGPTGVGKTATIEALPDALRALRRVAHVHRLDCSELSQEIQLTRVLGVAPGYVGHSDSTALLDALRTPGAILLLDEIEKAHPDFLDALLALLDTGELSDPNGRPVSCAHAVIALTSNLGWETLEERLGDTPLADRSVVARLCREHLVAEGMRPELVGRIGAFAVYRDLGDDARRAAALGAVRALAAEYDVRVEEVEPVVLDVVVDLADGAGAGARGLYHAARDLLAEPLADVAGADDDVLWSVVAGPPPVLVRIGG
jgi:ATP-dependent Clp protease ATP-binding subunit ClpB